MPPLPENTWGIVVVGDVTLTAAARTVTTIIATRTATAVTVAIATVIPTLAARGTTGTGTTMEETGTGATAEALLPVATPLITEGAAATPGALLVALARVVQPATTTTLLRRALLPQPMWSLAGEGIVVV